MLRVGARLIHRWSNDIGLGLFERNKPRNNHLGRRHRFDGCGTADNPQITAHTWSDCCGLGCFESTNHATNHLANDIYL
jgi:hypothetical protein